MLKGWPLTIVILLASVGLSAFLWSIGIYFFFLPIIFLPFLKFVKGDNVHQLKICRACSFESEGNYCPRCGTRLS